MENVSSRCGKSDNAPRLRFPEFSGEWVEKKLGEIFFEVNERKHPELPVLSIQQGIGTVFRDISERRIAYDKANINAYKVIEPGDFIIHLRSFEGGLECSKHKGISSPAYKILRSNCIDSAAFKDYFRSYNFIEGKLAAAVTGIRDGKNIDMPTFWSLKINIPSLPEQKKIAAFFTLLDRRIQKQRQLVECLKTYKRGVLQSVFSKNYKWEELSIEDIFSCIIDKNHPDKTVLTIVQGTGTLPRNSIDRKISYNAESVSSYKKVKENDFILHLRSFEGGLEIANEEGIVSPAYTILRATKNISPLFYYNYFRSYNFINEKLRIAVEGIRDGKSINMNTFWKIKVPFPPYELQNYYASFFSLIDKNIKKNESLLQALEKGKRQLLQKMFI